MRKQLGFTFLGETRDAFRMLLVDAKVNGLSSEVSKIIVICMYMVRVLTNAHGAQYMHTWGGFGSKSYVC